MEIRIQSIHFNADQKLIDFTNEKIGKLEKFFDHIIDADVFLKFDNASSHIKEKSANIKINVPGATFDAEGKSTTFEEAIEEAVESMRRQLKKYKEKLKN